MSQVNLFRIEESKVDSFLKFLEVQYETIAESTEKGFRFKLFVQKSAGKEAVNWKWAFSLFGKSAFRVPKLPKGVLIIQRAKLKGRTYAVSFGGGHFHVDSYCDREFGFGFACRVNVKNTKLTSTVNNNSKKNKTINSFKDFDRFEINSGESYTKLKLGIEMPVIQNKLIKDVIEVGSSLKFILKNDSFDSLIDLITFVERTLASEKKTRIPVCNVVRKPEEIAALNSKLEDDFLNENSSVTLSEFDIIGVDEVFVRADAFQLICERKTQTVTTLDFRELKEFFDRNAITEVKKMLKTQVKFMVNGNCQVTRSIFGFIDYLNESDNALLSGGIWYRFNADFCECLKESLNEIRVVYEPKYDFGQKQLDRFWDEQYQAHKTDKHYCGLPEKVCRETIRKKYYFEYAFNLMREREGYELCDRKLEKIHGEKMEICDLRKDNVLYFVKHGNSSAILSYAVTQSEAAIVSYANRLQPQSTKPDTVVLWLILSRKNHLTITDERMDWDQLGMLLLKMRIDSWKKKAREAGMKPEIRINYSVLE